MSLSSDERPGSAPRTPGAIQLVAAAVATILIATLALTLNQQPPPAIAEFAPQAIKQIKQAPPEQSSDFGEGKGAGDCRTGQPCAKDPRATGNVPGQNVGGTPSPGPPKGPPKGRVRQCVGEPPRQTEDPQSPPCVAFWDSTPGNGGATSRGVTADTILIGVPNMDGENRENQYTAYQNYFNTRYEFYGRKIKFVNIQANRGSAASEKQAADMAKELGIFASSQDHDLTSYYQALVEYGIIGVYRTPDYTDAQLKAYSPYLWGYTMSAEQQMRRLADWACTRLVGGNAVHAGTSDAEDLRTKKRKFAVILERIGYNSQLSEKPFASALRACGADVAFSESVPYSEGTTEKANRVVDLKSKGVTTIVCLCEEGNLGLGYHQSAQAQRYEPEWVITNYPQLNFFGHKTYNVPSQKAHTFGVAFQPMIRTAADHPSVWALREGSGASSGTDSLNVETHDIAYRALLLLASGIQLAGPRLTPETFRAGLQEAAFPNPPHPIMAGDVGFGAGGTTMTQDGAEIWWDPNATDPYGDSGPGAFCWVESGRRYGLGQWPKQDRLQQGPCDSGAKQVS